MGYEHNGRGLWEQRVQIRRAESCTAGFSLSRKSTAGRTFGRSSDSVGTVVSSSSHSFAIGHLSPRGRQLCSACCHGHIFWLVNEFFSRSARDVLRSQGAELTLRRTEGGWRAVSKGSLVSPKKVNVYLTKAFQANFGSVRAALRFLGRFHDPRVVPAPQRQSGPSFNPVSNI